MATTAPSCRTSYVLDGQGIPSATSPHTIDTAFRDAQAPLAHSLLLACHHALAQDLDSLSSDDCLRAGFGPADLARPDALLDLPLRHRHNAVVDNIHLYLVQILRYLACAPMAPAHASSQHSDVLGFSSGMLAAAVIACARDIPSFVAHAVSGFRLAFWLGLRSQQYVHRVTAGTSLAEQPWSLVIFGSTRTEVEAAVAHHSFQNPTRPPVHLSAVTHSTCISVSGRPDALQSFQSSCLPSSATTARFAPIHALYHSPELLDVATAVKRDLAQRRVTFPTSADLVRGLRSSVSGERIACASSSSHQSLADDIVDMILLHPVNFDRVTAAIDSECSGSPCILVNIGPGNALWRSVSRSCPAASYSPVDWSAAAAASVPVSPRSLAVKHTAVPREPIAIVGMAVQFPQADDADMLWKILEQGINTVSEIPEDRFNVSAYNAGTYGRGRSMKARHGNFLTDPSAFDNAFFRVSPREARSMDPQQRLLLHTSYHALEHAGFVPGATPSFDPDTFGVYVGVATADYARNLARDVDVYYSTGTLQAFLSGKISYAHGFSGPSVVVDTACSSSMVSIYNACRALQNRDCNAAVAGGVNVIASPDMYIGLDRAHFLSPSGQCKPWDASADGYARAEGCGMFVLKRLSDALAENDNVLGVIRAVEVNQSSQAASITQPHAPTQADLFRRLLASAGVEPRDVSVVEAHGTGTQTGDPTELTSIRAVFTDTPLHLTSIKANMGHAEAASGAASLAKLLLMLRHRKIPRCVSLKRLNPKLGADLAARIDTEGTVPWEGEGGGRLALLNNFGAAGSNAALLLQEHTDAPRKSDRSPAAFVLGLSCDSEQALEERRRAYLELLQDGYQLPEALADFTYTATARRQLHRFRLCVSGGSRAELAAELRRARPVAVTPAHKLVFVFSGQGGQYAGMGKGLYASVPVFRRVVDYCGEKVRGWGYGDILRIVLGEEEVGVDGEVLLYQCAVFVLECALAKVWEAWGLTPDAVAGHSLGEYAALVTAGVLSLDDGLALVAERARLMVERCASGTTGMLAVKLPAGKMQQYLVEHPELSIACYNSCEDVVVAGTLDKLTALQSALKASGHKCTRLNVPFAYHTDAMAPVLGDLTAFASRLTLCAPALPVVSNARGQVVQPGDASVFTAAYFARHCGEPVKFEQGMHDLRTQPGFDCPCTYIELGPHPTTLPMLRRPGPDVYLPSLKRNAEDWAMLAGSLAELYCSNHDVRWRAVFRDCAPEARLVDLPAYPFAKTQFWVPYKEPAAAVAVAPAPSLSTRFTLLATCVSLPGAYGSSEPAVFETPVDRLAPLIEGHKVAEYALCPASVYVEMATASAQHVAEHFGQWTAEANVVLTELTFPHPLVNAKNVRRTVRVSVSLTAGSFEVSSHLDDAAETTVHCAGTVSVSSTSRVSEKLLLSSTMVDRRYRAVLAGPAETFRTRTIYDVIFPRVVAYSPTYHSIKTLTLDPNGVDAYAVVQLPADTPSGNFTVDPVFADTLLHAAGFFINCSARQNEAFICSQVDKIRVLSRLIRRDAQYGVYCNIGLMSDGLAIADAYAFELGRPDVVVVAHMKRMRFRKLKLSSFKSVLSLSAAKSGHVTAQAAVRALELPRAAPSPPPSEPKSKPASLRLEIRSGATQVRDVMASVLGMRAEDLTEDQDLERLGLDSLTSIEARHALCSALNVVLPESLFANCKNLRQVCTAVLLSSSSTSLPPTPVAAGSDAGSYEQVTLSNSESERSDADRLRDVIASVLDVPAQDLTDDLDFERLGMDSLMSIEAHHAVCETMDIKLPQDIFTTCKSLRDLRQSINALHSTSCPSPSPDGRARSFGMEVNPVRLQLGEDPKAQPLFLVHDGSGVANCYGRLSLLGRTVWGIHNPKFSTGEKWEGGIVEMAEHYAAMIREKLAPGQGCIVGGWSVGGVIGFEVVRKLMASGVSVGGLVLIDSPDPNTSTPLSEDVLASIFSNHSNSRAIELAKVSMRHCARALVEYDPSRSANPNVVSPKAVMLRSSDAFCPDNVRTESDEFLNARADPNVVLAGWERLLGRKVPLLDIPGHHFQPFDPPHVAEVSLRLAEALSLISS